MDLQYTADLFVIFTTHSHMHVDQVITFWGTQVAAAAAIGVTQPTISMWRARGSVPRLQQLRIEHLTGGRLKADKAILGRKPVARKFSAKVSRT